MEDTGCVADARWRISRRRQIPVEALDGARREIFQLVPTKMLGDPFQFSLVALSGGLSQVGLGFQPESFTYSATVSREGALYMPWLRSWTSFAWTLSASRLVAKPPCHVRFLLPVSSRPRSRTTYMVVLGLERNRKMISSPDLGPMESMFAVEDKANEEETSCTHG